METRAHHVLIGVCTLVGGAAMLLFALWMMAALERDFQRYDILFSESVSGLTSGSPVQYSGLRVGEVESLMLDRDDPRQVWVRVRVSSDVPVRTDTRATLTLLNITGASGIALSQGEPGSPRLVDVNGGIPVIEAEPSPLAQLRVNSDELLLNVTTLLENANAVLSEDNLEKLSSIMTNIDDLTSSLVGHQDGIREGLQSLVDAGASLNEMVVRLDGQLDRYVEPMFNNAAETMDNVNALTRELNTLVVDSRPALERGLQGVAELQPAMQDLRAILDSINAIANRIEDDPRGFLLGDQIMEFRP